VVAEPSIDIGRRSAMERPQFLPPSKTPTIPPQMESSEETVGDEERLSAATTAIEGLVAAIQKDAKEKRKRSWIEKNATISVFILGGVIVAAQFFGQKFLQSNIEEVVEPIQKATEEKIEKMETQYKASEKEDAKERKVLRQNDGDIAEHALESDRYNQTILKGISKKMKVETPKKPPELEDAEDRVREVKRRGRE
jgi:hypothetical protein